MLRARMGAVRGIAHFIPKVLSPSPRVGRLNFSIISSNVPFIEAFTASSTNSGYSDSRLIRRAAMVAGSGLVLWAATPDKSPSVVSCSSNSVESKLVRTSADQSNAAGTRSSVTTEKSVDGASKVVSAPVAKDSAVALVVASTYNGNGPIEDRHDIRQSPRGDFFASVYDGHGGWQTAELARKRLNIIAQMELKNSLADDNDQIKSALTQAFLRVEREYLYMVKGAFDFGFGAVARTGACAIMALLRDDKLYVANAGDCRAVLGRRRRRAWGGGGVGGDGISEAIALSNDHNARELTEQAKLRKLHPLEGDVFTCKRAGACYVKGRLQVRVWEKKS